MVRHETLLNQRQKLDALRELLATITLRERQVFELDMVRG